MQISMQERDAILAGLHLLKEAMQANLIKITTENADENHLADLFFNGGSHKGLSVSGIDSLADLVVNEFPNPAIAAEESKDERKIKVSLDGGVTFIEAKEGVRIIYEGVMIDGEDGLGELHVNANHEGLISDVWTTRDEPLDHNIGTKSEMIEDMVCAMVEANE